MNALRICVVAFPPGQNKGVVMGVKGIGRSRAMQPLETRTRISTRVRVSMCTCISAMLLALIVPLVSAAPASAANFANCPGSGPPVQCVWVEITSGDFNVGDTSVAITNPFRLEGGFDPTTLTFYEAEPERTLTRAQQNLLGSYVATIELANEAGHPPAPLTANPEVELNLENLLLEENTALALPVNIKVDGPLVGSGCLIGPIALHLTTGTTSPPTPNGPIAGAVGALEFLEEGNLVVINHDKLVDNAFAEPEATGCGSPWMDLFINALFELPSAAGNNTVTFNNRFEVHD